MTTKTLEGSKGSRIQGVKFRTISLLSLNGASLIRLFKKTL
jgi:hypothetical protein